MRRLLPALTSAALLAAGAASAAAQSCLGLAPLPHVSLAVGFEGTDGLSGSSAAVMYGRRSWGLQLRGERYDDQGESRDAWYGGEVQVSRAWRRGGAAGGGQPLCSTAGVRYHDDAFGDSRYQRLRVPLGVALGRDATVSRDASGQPALVLSPFVQPQLLLQHERWQAGAATPVVTRSRIAAAAVVGVGMSADPIFFRSAVQYATLPGYSLNRRHNWFELTLQAGVSF